MEAMNKDKMDPLGFLVENLVQDFLDMTDAEIAIEIRERGEDPVAVAAKARAVFERALTAKRKASLIQARNAVDTDAAHPRTVIAIDGATARARLQRLLRRFPEAATKLTLAARNGVGLSDSDVLGLLTNFHDLGIDDENDT
jgi:hypothetical protein